MSSTPNSICTPSTDPKPKRTRVGGRQSKYGCFTCRARRVKCGEEKPFCAQCTRTGRTCDGYPSRVFIVQAAPPASDASSTDALSTVSRSISASRSRSASPYHGLGDGILETTHQAQLVSFGMKFLSYDHRPVVSNQILDQLLPQLCYSVPTLRACVAAFASAFMLESTKSTYMDEDRVILSYIQAMRCVRTEMIDRTHGTMPLLLSCMLLAFVELMLKKTDNVLVHLRGAYQLLMEQMQEHQKSHDIDVEDLGALFRGIDLYVAEYAIGYIPELPVSEKKTSIISLSSATGEFYRLVHGAYAWSARMHRYKFRPWEMPSSAVIEQGRQISYLSTWLEELDRNVLPTLVPETPEYAQALCLKANCLATMIQICWALFGPESTFDRHNSQFRELMDVAEAALPVCDNADIPEQDRGAAGSLYVLRRQPFLVSISGRIAHALFFTARFCRHPQIRRRAITVLARCGREGPWLGERDAMVVARLVQYEEAWPNSPPPVPESIDAFLSAPVPVLNEDEDLVDLIPEAARMHVAGRDIQGFPTKSRKVGIGFIQCLDMDALMRCKKCRNGPEIENGRNDWFKLQWRCSENHWKVWEEVVDY